MKPLDLMTTIQIEITNHCNLSCAACTRHAGHQRDKYFMTKEMFIDCLLSLTGFEGIVGIMGGEPTLHPDFQELMEIYQMMIPKERRGLWTNMANWKRHEKVILETFLQDRDHMLKNDHKAEGSLHHPLLVAIKDVVPDEVEMWRLIHDCPYQNRWSASINHKGAFFCEVAAAQDVLFAGPGGWEIRPDWWKKRNGMEFREQIDRYCPNCGGAVPIAGIDPHSEFELISPSNVEKLSDLGILPKYELFDRKITPEELQAAYAGGYHPLKHRKEECIQ